MILRAEDVNLIHFNPDRVSYEPKGIHTEAIHVTIENIGKLALEFEAEVKCREDSYRFWFDAARPSEGNPEASRPICICVGDVIVPIRGEIHVYDSTIFGYTFSPDQPSLFEEAQGQIKTIEELRTELGEPPVDEEAPVNIEHWEPEAEDQNVGPFQSPDFAPGGPGTFNVGFDIEPVVSNRDA